MKHTKDANIFRAGDRQVADFSAAVARIPFSGSGRSLRAAPACRWSHSNSSGLERGVHQPTRTPPGRSILDFLLFVSFRVFRGRISEAEEDEVNERYNAETEEECVSLQVSDLDQSQERADAPGSPTGSTYCAGVDDPAIYER